MSINSLITGIHTPLKLISESLFSSGENTPRMTLSKNSSLSSEELQLRLRDLELDREFRAFTDAVLPYEIMMLVITHLARISKSNRKDLLTCSKVSKRFNVLANMFIWSNIEIKTKNSFNALMNTLLSNYRTMNFGILIKSITLKNISFIERNEWDRLLSCCPRLVSLCLERCVVEKLATPSQSLMLYPQKLSTLILSDSPSFPLEPILSICSRSPGITRLAISGCNYNEKDMCAMVTLCPNLRDIKLGSHAGASLTTVGSAGGDEFAQTLTEKCPLLVGADLTGIISMTEVGWTRLMNGLGNRLQKLYIRRAMQIPLDSLLLVRNCTSLKRLTIANVPHMDDDTIIRILQGIGRNLIFLQLESIMVTDNVLFSIATDCPALSQLRLFQCPELENLEILLKKSNLKRLETLIIHNCDSLACNAVCSRVMRTNSVGSINFSPESSVLPEIRRIRDTSYMSPNSAEHLASSPASALLGNTPSSPATTCCDINVPLVHLELVGCDQIDQKGLESLIKHWTNLKRFIYVGSGLDSNLRKHLQKRKHLSTSIYALTPSTPNFRTEYIPN